MRGYNTREVYDDILSKGRMPVGSPFQHEVTVFGEQRMSQFINGWFSNGKDMTVLGRVKVYFGVEKSRYCIGQNWTLRDIKLLEGIGCEFDKSAHNYQKLVFGIFQELGT